MASSQPSSSSSRVPTRGSTYDIFLSFRGEDTRNNFVDHLFAALDQKGIRTFKDDQMLGGGKPISHSLLNAIKESKFAIVVFSKNYANSSWCLDELLEIMECHDQMGLKVLPVFYHVDPSDVRKQKGNFTIDFQEHQQNKRSDVCGQKRDFPTAFEQQEEKWKKALTTAANISGYHISSVSGGESATINKIIQEILVGIQPSGREENLIGIEFHMDKMNSLLNIEATDVVRIIGIHGMGGIGKTTIARALFRRIAYKFQGSSFVSNVRENSSSNKGICALQEKILTDILGAHHKLRIEDHEYGADMLRERFSFKKVLLVLDDVDDVKQLEFLGAAHDWYGLGSRIFITTRDKHVLDAKTVKYRPSLLRMDQALELFSRHAFKKNSPPDELKELSDRAIRYTSGLPLALKVLGSFFHGREADVWESALDRLSKTPNKEIFTTLKLSFDGLEKLEKDIFLDITCFFKGSEVDYVTRVLDSFGFFAKIGITSLIEKSLITISKQRLDMHDLIQEMGWQIVHESFPNSRLWKREQLHDLSIKSMNFEIIEAIVLRPELFGVDLGEVYTADVFEKMKNLRLLDIDYKFTSHKPTILPHELRWLRWNCSFSSQLPVENMCKLVGLEMSSGIMKHLWEGQKIMPSLKFIQLHGLECLTRFPNVSGAPNIERLILSKCENLVEVDESLGSLKRLVYLDMRFCRRLKNLPSKINMESLETLILESCNFLERLPEFSISMVKLYDINCGYCFALQELPTSIRNAINLRMLNLRHCSSLKNIPESISDLKCLRTLRLEYCSRLQNLPKEFENMKNLQELHLGTARSFNLHDLRHLTNLYSLRKLNLSNNYKIKDEDFPKTLHGLSSLEELNLSLNSNLIQLPASISHLSRLKHLDLSFCDQLQSVNGLPSGIEVLDASGCFSLQAIEDLSEEYEWLHKIHLFGCKKLLADNQSEKYLDKMLKQSFLKKWAAIDCCSSISIPGNKIPSLFKEQQYGFRTSLKLPFEWQTKLLGFAVCGVIRVKNPNLLPCIEFRFENGGTFIPKLEVDYINVTAATALGDEFDNVWIAYVPFTLLESMHHNDDDREFEDWSHIIEGNLVIEISSYFGGDVVRCGAQVVYKEDVELTQQTIKPSISSSYYWNWKLTHVWSQGTIRCS